MSYRLQTPLKITPNTSNGNRKSTIFNNTSHESGTGPQTPETVVA